MTRSQQRFWLVTVVVVGAIVVILGVVAATSLVRQNQDNRNQAWGGHETLPAPDWKTGSVTTSPPKVGF